MTEFFINFGGLDLVFRLISHRDIDTNEKICLFLIRLCKKYPISFIEKPIYVEKLMMLIDSVSTFKEVLTFKLKVIYSILGEADYYDYVAQSYKRGTY